MHRILIIDNSMQDVLVLSSRLKDCSVEIATSFTQAASMVEHKRYDAIVVGVDQLPAETVIPKQLFAFLKRVHGSTIVITNHDDAERDAESLDELLHRIKSTDLVGLASDVCDRIKQVQAKIEANC